MKKLLLYLVLFLVTWLLLAQFVILKNRISDDNAIAKFKSHGATVRIYDTLIQNRHIHYSVCGDDSLPTLLFIHGSPGSWSNYMEYMWDTDLLKKYRLASIDRPGFGYSDFGQPVHLKQEAALIMPVIKKLKSRADFYLFGHSLGAPVAIQLAADGGPDLIHKIILMGSPLDIAQEEKETWRRIMGVKPFYWLLPGALGPSNTELLFLKEDLLPLQQEFKKVRSNVAFIHGDKDDWVPIENIAYGKKMLINAQSLSSDTVHGAGHLIPWVNREVFKKLLEKLY